MTGHAAGSLRIRQFLDIGAGLPAPGPTHEMARKISPACKVGYVDNDPLVLAHGRALTTARPGAQPCAWLHGDVRDPDAILEQAETVLDFTKPVAVLLLALLHFVSDEEDPAGIVTRFAAALAPGSLIAISHLTGDFAPRPAPPAQRPTTPAYPSRSTRAPGNRSPPCAGICASSTRGWCRSITGCPASGRPSARP